MELILWRYKCTQCGNEFNLSHIEGDGYGEFIMRTITGRMVYLNSFEDEGIFDEFEKIFKDLIKKHNLPKYKIGPMFQELYSITCDLAPDGNVYKIASSPICTCCSGSDMSVWGPLQPITFLNFDIPKVPHENWKKLTHSKKEDLSRRAINDYLQKMTINR